MLCRLVFANGHQAPETAYTKEYMTKEGIEGITRKSERKKTNVCLLYCSTANPGHVQIIQEQERKGEGREGERRALNEARNAECGRKVDRA